MKLITVKAAELTGPALRYAVALVEGLNEEFYWKLDSATGGTATWTDDHGCYDPDENWQIGGPLFDKYVPLFTLCNGMFRAEIVGGVGFGATYLIALCRAIVAAKFANVNGELMVPAELVGGAA